MNWGKSITLALVLFATFIGTLVTVCVKQDVNLVTKDYYKEELAYQLQIDRMAHTAMLSERPVISVEDGSVLKISYADFENINQGSLELFRPSDPALDRRFELGKSANSSVYLSTKGMQKGMYRAKLRWQMAGTEFFVEQLIKL